MFLPFLAPIGKALGFSGGDEEIRTLDPLLAGQVLSQLSYTPGYSQSLFTDPENRTTKSVSLSSNSSVFCLFDALL